MSDACQPILRSGGPGSYPGVPFSTTRLEISSSPVRAVIVTTLEIGVPALVMNIFSPSITHEPSGCSTARVRVLPASDPASGSVSPKAASARPLHRSGRRRSFCSSLPKSRIGDVPREVCAATVTPSEESTRVSSSTVIA